MKKKDGINFRNIGKSSPPVIISEKEKKELASINTEISALREKVIETYRKAAWDQGIAALKLDDLSLNEVSFSGAEIIKIFGYEKATIYKESSVTTGNGEKIIFPFGEAYLCKYPKSLFGKSTENDSNTCGWVIGNPETRPYDNIGHLSGSRGEEYYCRICGKRIGQLVGARS